MAFEDYQPQDKIAIGAVVLSMGAVFGGLVSMLTEATPLIAGIVGIGVAAVAVPLGFDQLARYAARMVKAEEEERRKLDPKKVREIVKEALALPRLEPEVEFESSRYRDFVSQQSQQQPDSGCRLH